MLSSKYKDLKFYSDDDTKKIADELEKAITVPVNIEVEAEHRVYDFSEMKTILEGAQRIAVYDCGCKTEYENCDAPRNVCISLAATVIDCDSLGSFKDGFHLGEIVDSMCAFDSNVDRYCDDMVNIVRNLLDFLF